MNPLDYFRTLLRQFLLTAMIALRALRRNKMRSALGQNLLTIFAGSRSAGGVNSGLGSASALTIEDAEAIRREVSDVVAVSPEDSTTAQAIANGRNWSTTIAGESPEYLEIRDWNLTAGSMFTAHDVRAAAKVAVVGSETAHELFGPLNPVGQTVRIKNMPFIIIGLLESKGTGMGGMNQDDRIIIPYTTAMRLLTGDKYLRSISVQISSSDRMDAAEQQITSLLRQRHRLPPGRDNDFSIFNQKEIADTVSSVSTIITLLLGAIGGISLLVGGIGIMNIMLVSVTERTREIGIRIAVGAQPADILLQFLIEAITLSLLGGMIGVLLGVGASDLVGRLTTFVPIVSTSSILLAFGVSCAVGIFFGFYPARKAALLNPIDALRYE